MPDLESSEADGLASFLAGQGSFGLSLLAGAIVIALYARKRIAEFSAPPKGEEYDFTKMLTMDDIVGHRVFYKSYIFYVLLLEFLYFFVCTSKPLVLLMSGDEPGATFKGAAWPLGAALLVVGLLPSTPAVAQLEEMLRGLAQRVASIPGEFYERVGRLSRSEIEKLVNLAPDYKPEMRKFWRIHNLLASLGFAVDDARLMARSCVSAELFSQWTLQGGRIWNTEEFEKYRDIISVLKPKTELLRKETEALLASSQKVELVAAIWQKQGVTDPSSPLPEAMLDAIVDDADKAMKALPETPETEQDIRDVNRITSAVEGWKKLASDSEVAAKRLSALFAIIARNDRHTVRQLRQPNNVGAQFGTGKPDAVVAGLVKLLEESYAPQVWSNAVVTASAAGAIFCALLLSIYFHGVEIVEAVQNGFNGSTGIVNSALDAIKIVETTSVIRDSMFTSATLFCSFGLASLVALFLRSVKIEDGDWVFFNNFRRMPLSNYYVIALWGSLAAFMPLVVSWILYYYDPGEANVGAISSKPPAAIAQALAFRFLLGFTAVAYAIGVCIIADIVDTTAKELRRYGNVELCARLAAAVVFIEFVCLIVNPSYALDSKPFWSNVVAVLLFSYAALRTFLSSYEAYTKG